MSLGAGYLFAREMNPRIICQREGASPSPIVLQARRSATVTDNVGLSQVGKRMSSIAVALPLCCCQVGDIVTVTAMNINGQWEGEVNGKHGDFPFVYIQFEDELGVDNIDPDSRLNNR